MNGSQQVRQSSGSVKTDNSKSASHFCQPQAEVGHPQFDRGAGILSRVRFELRFLHDPDEGNRNDQQQRHHAKAIQVTQC